MITFQMSTVHFKPFIFAMTGSAFAGIQDFKPPSSSQKFTPNSTPPV